MCAEAGKLPGRSVDECDLSAQEDAFLELCARD